MNPNGYQGLAVLREFFTVLRDGRGSYFSPTEDVVNGSQRRLSTRTEAEVLTLRDGALSFAAFCDDELSARIGDPPEDSDDVCSCEARRAAR